MDRKKSLLEIHAAVLLFGLAGLFGKWFTLSPFIIVLGRVFFGSLALAAILWFTRQKYLLATGKSSLLLSCLGLILASHWVFFFQSIQVSTVAVGLLSYSSFPVFTVFLEPLFLKTRIEASNLFYALLCLLGIFLIIPHFDLNDSTFAGVLWGLASGITFAVLSVLNRKLAQNLSSLVIAFYQDFFALLFLLPFFFLLRPALSSKDLLLLALLGVFCTALSHSLFIKGMRLIPAQTAAVISSLEPVYGIALASLFLKEIPSARTVSGGILILGTALAVTWKGSKA